MRFIRIQKGYLFQLLSSLFFHLDWNRINWKTRGGQKLIILLYFQLNVKYIYTNWSLMYEKIGFSHFKKEIEVNFWYWVEKCLKRIVIVLIFNDFLKFELLNDIFLSYWTISPFRKVFMDFVAYRLLTLIQFQWKATQKSGKNS